jgi:hypothetical protein
MKPALNIKTLILTATIVLSPMQSMAAADTVDYETLVKQLKELQNRISVLEATRPTFTTFMPNISERFHVMHRAGEAGDWAVASHELEELKRLTAISTYIDADNGKLMQEMMAPSFRGLEGAIEHGSEKKFQKALGQTVSTCNACHTATGSEFIQVTLDADDAVSIRHPHTFSESGMSGGHTHGSQSHSQQMMN